MSRRIWFRGEILCTLKKRADRPWKNKGALDNGSATANILVGCLSCVSKGPCFALGARALALMTSWEVVSPLHPIRGEHALCQSTSQMLVLGTRYKKMLENALKRHAIQSDLYTISAGQESLPITFIFLPCTVLQQSSMVCRRRCTTLPSDRRGAMWNKVIFCSDLKDLLWSHRYP